VVDTMSTALVDVEAARDRVKAEAADEADGWYRWLEQADALRVCGVPRKVRHSRAVSGRSYYRRGQGGEHDALEVLPPSELGRLRDNGWLTHDGRADADEVLERLADVHHLDDIDHAWQDWLRATRIIDAAGAVALGRRPGRWARDLGYRWWSDIAPVCEADGIDVAGVFSRDVNASTERVDVSAETSTPEVGTMTRPAPSSSGRLEQYLGRLVHGPKVDYAAALVDHYRDGAPMPAAPDRDWAPKVQAKIARLCGVK